MAIQILKSNVKYVTFKINYIFSFYNNLWKKTQKCLKEILIQEPDPNIQKPELVHYIHSNLALG